MRQLDLFGSTSEVAIDRSIEQSLHDIPSGARSLDGPLWNEIAFTSGKLAELLGMEITKQMSPAKVLEQAAAMICLDVLAQDIYKSTLRMRKRLPGGGSRIVESNEHPAAALLALEPNQRHTWEEVIGMWVYHLGMVSNAYSYVKRQNDGTASSIIPVVPNRAIEFINQDTGEVFYDLSATNMQEVALLGFRTIRAPERDVLHIRQRMLDGFWGHSTIRAGSRTLQLARELEDYETTLFGDNAVMPGVFVRDSSKGAMSEPAFARAKSQLKKLRDNILKRSSTDPILLEDGLKYEDLAMNAQEAELAKTLDSAIAAVCKLWRMPPHKAMHLTSVKYENLTAMESVYVRDTLIPICKLIERRLGKALLTTAKERMQFFFEFDREEMSVTDAKDLSDRVDKAVGKGLIEINEGRVKLGWNRATWGDVRMVMVNTVLVDRNNVVVVSGAKSSSPKDQPQDQPTDGQDQPTKDGGHLRLVTG